MTRRLTSVVVLVGVLFTVSVPLRAQDVVPVFDESNFIEAIAQVLQLVKEVENMIFQAARLPVNMAARYHATSPTWTTNALASVSPGAAALLAALNQGDPGGNGYRQVVDPLDTSTDVVGRMPAALQRRFTDAYAAVQLADSVTAMGVDQSGTARASGNTWLQILQSMESDAFSLDSTFHSETALLNKINSTGVLGLREGEETNQFLSDAIEQLVVETTRTRDTEAKLMNATINQWRYGPAYGQSLFQNTAANLDTWRLP